MGDDGLGITVWGEDLRYEVGEKVILDNVSFVALPGQFTAVMGPSGSGKTTLLNSMLDRLRGCKGNVHFNSVPVNTSGALQRAHYVMAHDIALAYLTVRETLMFTARLRMPSASKAAQTARVNEVMEWLALEECADTYVGGEWRKGISKGQMKRLAIASELLGDPKILILDEPTSGLDSHLALDLCIRLRKIAHDTNTTVIASIHQPSQRAFDCFDRVVLISNGGIVYSGSTTNATEYFESFYRSLPEGYSVPDYLLELATIQEFTGAHPVKGKETAGGASTEATSLRLMATAANNEDETSSRTSIPQPFYSTAARIELMFQAFRQSEHYAAMQKHIEEAKGRDLGGPDGASSAAKKEDRNKWNQEFSIVWKRSTLNSVRNPLTTIIILLVNIIQALILGALFFQLQRDVTETEVEHIPVSQWPLWDNVVIDFLAYGVDQDGLDPFLDILENGVDGNDRSVLFDFMTNQDVIDWIPQVAECIRTRFEDLFLVPEGFIYPPWKWEVGSINGSAGAAEAFFRPISSSDRRMLQWMGRDDGNDDDDDTTTTTTVEISSSSTATNEAEDTTATTTTTTSSETTTTLSSAATSPSDIDDGDDGLSTTTEDRIEQDFLVSMPMESVVSMIVQTMQLFDYMITGKFEPPVFNHYYGASGNALMYWWLNGVRQVAPYVTQVTCCASLGYEFSTTTSYPCDDSYPWPEPPLRKLGEWPNFVKEVSTISLKLQDAMATMMDRMIERKLLAAQNGAAIKPAFNGNVIKTMRSLEATMQRMNAAADLDGQQLGAAAERLEGTASNVPRRKLAPKSGSSLGGLVTDLWALIFNNPNTPLYKMIENLGNWMDRIRNECTNNYCGWVTTTWDSLGDQLSNITATILTVLNFAGALFFGAGNIGFASYDVLLQFPKERTLFNREAANKLYRPLSYFLAKLVADLPFQLLPAIVWTVIYYFMIGLHDGEAWKPFAYLAVSLCVSFCAYSLGYMISAMSPRAEVALVATPLVLVVMLVQAGFVLRDADYPSWIGWFRFLSVYRYGFFGMCCIAFPKGGTYGSLDNDMILPLLGVMETRIWANIVCLLGLAVGYRICAFFALKYMHRRTGIEA